MYRVLFLIPVFFVQSLWAQTVVNQSAAEKKGFVFGLGAGAGILTLHTKTTNAAFSASLPNIKAGFMLNRRLALVALLPGATYRHEGKDRGFEALTLAGQYWLKNKWWVLAGAGLTFDAPAFYTVKDPNEAQFFTGFPALEFSTGYELWRKKHFALDLQYRIFLGVSYLDNHSTRGGVANMLILGFNWY